MANIVIAIASVSLLIAVYVLVSSLVNTIGKNTINASEADIAKASAVKIETTTGKAPINENIVKIGTTEGIVTAGGASSGPMSGEDVFKSTCSACHSTGVLDAPKFGDNAAWAPRFANGFDSLLNNALHGKGNMPPKGGNAGLSDGEIKAAIIYMLKESGIDAGVSIEKETSAKDTASSDNAKSDSSVTPETDTNTDTAVATLPTTDEKPQSVTSTTSEDNVKTTSQASEQPSKEAASATNTANTEMTTTTDIAPVGDMKVAPQTPEQPAAPEQPQTPNTPEQPKAPAITDKSATAPAATTKTATTVTNTPVITAVSDVGKQLYEKTCHTCHAAGVAGAPILGNKEQWSTRIAQGMETLYNSALHGKNAMPPKGTAMDASDEAIKAAVDYMVSHVK